MKHLQPRVSIAVVRKRSERDHFNSGRHTAGRDCHEEHLNRAGYVGVILGVYWCFMGIMENKMETTI